MKNKDLVFFDLETSGLDPFTQEILQIAAIRVDSKTLNVIDRFEVKLWPKKLHLASETALKVNHFSREVWLQEAVPQWQGLELFAEFVKGSVLIGYNVTFDWGFLSYACNQLGVKLDVHYHRLDVMSMVYAIFANSSKELNQYSLSEACKMLSVTNPAPHTAGGDTEATLEVYRRLPI